MKSISRNARCSALWLLAAGLPVAGCGSAGPVEEPPSDSPLPSDHLGGASSGPNKWKTGLFTNSSGAYFLQEQTNLVGGGGGCPLQVYMNYGNFRSFEPGNSTGQGIVDLSMLHKYNLQMELAFEPTDACFCHGTSNDGNDANNLCSGETTGHEHGCRMSDLTASAAAATRVPAAAAYAQIAALADALDQPLLIRFGSEMNASWTDWGWGYDHTHNSPAEFKAAFQFAHDTIKKNLHKGSVQFVFAPNNASCSTPSGSGCGTPGDARFASDMAALYPNGYVNILGIDGYSTTPGGTFQSDIVTPLKVLEGIDTKSPVFLAEFASATAVASRAQWLDAAEQNIKADSRIQYLTWFDADRVSPPARHYKLSYTDSAGYDKGHNLYKEFAKDMLGICSSPTCVPTGSACSSSSTCCSQAASCTSDGVSQVCCFPKGNTPDNSDQTDCCDGKGLDASGACL